MFLTGFGWSGSATFSKLYPWPGFYPADLKVGGENLFERIVDKQICHLHWLSLHWSVRWLHQGDALHELVAWWGSGSGCGATGHLVRLHISRLFQRDIVCLNHVKVHGHLIHSKFRETSIIVRHLNVVSTLNKTKSKFQPQIAFSLNLQDCCKADYRDKYHSFPFACSLGRFGGQFWTPSWCCPFEPQSDR